MVTNMKKPTTVTATVSTLLDTLKLDEEGQARAAIALALAGKLDDAADNVSGAVSVAVPGLARELSATLDVLMASQLDSSDFLAGIFEKSP